MLMDSMEHARDDMDARNLREQQVEAERVLEALDAALAADGEALLSTGERAELEEKMTRVRQAAAGSDLRALKQAIENLNKTSSEFAARRMNASIQKALSGHTLDEFE
jgi:molecular chaperone HscA